MKTPESDGHGVVSGVTRRRFIAGSAAVGIAATGIEGILAARRAPAFAQGTRLNILRWVDFIPACDVELKRQAVDASKALGAEVVFEFINANDLQARITAAIQSASGPDVIMMLHNWAHLYQNSLVDMTDLGEWQGKDQGGYYGQAEAAAKDGKRWLALPHGIVGLQFAYRKSWFDEVGQTSWPKTLDELRKVGKRWLALPHGIVGLQFAYRKSWFDEVGQTSWPKTLDELRQVGMKLKKKGKPIGQTLGHTFGDAPAWSYPLVWGFGGAEVDKTGKKVVLNSKETIESVKFMQAYWKDACDEGGFAWDDTSNNRAFLSGEIAATLNGASIYIAAKRGQDKIKDDKGEAMVKDILHGPIPNGPAGTWGYHVAFAHAVMKYGKNPKLAKDLLKWLHGKEQASRSARPSTGSSTRSGTPSTSP